jgi:hypothetical protein
LAALAWTDATEAVALAGAPEPLPPVAANAPPVIANTKAIMAIRVLGVKCFFIFWNLNISYYSF